MKVKGGYDGNQFNVRYLYNELFGVIPSEFVITVNELIDDEDEADETEIDMKKITNEFLLTIFPDGEFSRVLGRTKKDAVSCANETESKVVYGSVYVNNEFYQAGVMVLNRVNNTIVKITSKALIIFYDGNNNNFDPETYLDDIIVKFPLKRDDDEDLPVIGLVSYSNNGEYYVVESEINETVIDIDKNYNDDFKNPYDSIIEFIESDERKSGLILLNGEPGTGKTYFLRHLITKFKDKNFILITPHIAARLASPEFMNFLIENKDSVFILEDCEQVIMDRKSNSFSSAVSSVLNMSDGLMSDVFNGKFICTFNADTAIIDEAILRKGRCFAKYTFGKLEEKKAKKLLKERGVKLDNPGDMTLADIYNYDVKNVDDSKSKKKIGF
jgi:hypothetical protein